MVYRIVSLIAKRGGKGKMCDAIAAELISFSLASVRHVVNGAGR